MVRALGAHGQSRHFDRVPPTSGLPRGTDIVGPREFVRFDGPDHDLKEQARQVGGHAERLMHDLCDLGARRIAQMDAAGIDMQVVSLTASGANNRKPPRQWRSLKIPMTRWLKQSPSIREGCPASLRCRLRRRIRRPGSWNAASRISASPVLTTNSSNRSWRPPKHWTRQSIYTRPSRQSL